MATQSAISEEQLILLPITPQTFTLTTDPAGLVELFSGAHAIVVSGYINIGSGGVWNADPDDDNVNVVEIKQTVGPVWRKISQVSAIVTPAGLASLDADEVDHSRWVVRRRTWDEKAVQGGMQIELKISLEFQGFGNAWINLAYQVIATGDLIRMPKPNEVSSKLS